MFCQCYDVAETRGDPALPPWRTDVLQARIERALARELKRVVVVQRGPRPALLIYPESNRSAPIYRASLDSVELTGEKFQRELAVVLADRQRRGIVGGTIDVLVGGASLLLGAVIGGGRASAAHSLMEKVWDNFGTCSVGHVSTSSRAAASRMARSAGSQRRCPAITDHSAASLAVIGAGPLAR